MAFRRINRAQQPIIPSANNEVVPPAIIAPPRRREIPPESPGATGPVAPEQLMAVPPEYIVGKNKPPLHTRWKKGHSGNPKGRPKGSRNYDTVAIEVFLEKWPVRTASGEKMMDTVELALNKLREKVGKGEMQAIGRTLDESRRLMPPPPVTPTTGDPSAQLSPAEQQILASLLEGQGLPPMILGKPQFVEPDIADAIAAADEAGEEHDESDFDDEGFDDDDDDHSEEWED